MTNKESNSKKILHLISNRWNSAIAEYALSSVYSLRSAGHRNVLVGLVSSPVLKRSKEKGIKTIEVNSFSVLDIHNLAKLIRAEKPDRVITYGGPEAFNVSLLLMLRCVFVRYSHTRFKGSGLGRSKGSIGMFRDVLTQYLGLLGVDQVVVPSQSVYKTLSRSARNKSKIIVIGLDDSMFFYCSEKPLQRQSKQGEEYFFARKEAGRDIDTGTDNSELHGINPDQNPLQNQLQGLKTLSLQSHRNDGDEGLSARPVLAIFGRLDPVKGHAEFLEIFRDMLVLWPGGARPQLHIIGLEKNTKVAHLTNVVSTLGLGATDVLFFPEVVSNPAVTMSQATLGIIPSLGSEYICRVAEEFLLCGTPIFVSGAGGLSEVSLKEFDRQHRVISSYLFTYRSKRAASDLLLQATRASLGDKDQAGDLTSIAKNRSIAAAAEFGFRRMGERLSEAFFC